jgi:hypothetical protein
VTCPVSCAHTAHQVAPDSPHPPHVVGSAISRVARSEARTTPVMVMHPRLSAMEYEDTGSQQSVDGGANGRWDVENGRPLR